jgi:putative transposase
MRKSYKYRLFPTKVQRTQLNQTLETCRQVYNSTLGFRKQAWEVEQKSLTLYHTNKVLTGWKATNPDLSEVHSQVLQNVQERVDLAFKAFFRRVKAGQSQRPPGGKNGFPRFKGFGRYDSFTFKQSGFKLAERLTISKIGDVKIKLHRPLEGTIKTLTIQRDAVGNWYACFSCDAPPKPLPRSGLAVGVDLGLTTFLTLSNGETVANPRFFRQEEKVLARAQRKLSQQTTGTPERRQAKKVVAHIHNRIAHKRRDFAHKESRKLVNHYGFIAFEALNITGMVQNHSLAKSISDVAWNQLVQFTAAKAEEAGRVVVLVDPRNTTKMCSRCGLLVDKTLSERVHKCPHCSLEMNRDLNASINILRIGLDTIGLKSVEAPSL